MKKIKCNRLIGVLLALAALTVGCKTVKTEHNEEVRYLNSTSGCVQNNWQFQYQGQWYPATVPGNIHEDLRANNLIPDPFFGTNEDSVQWVSDSTWTYRLYFDKNCAGDTKLTHSQLVFEGLDTYAEVRLNGKILTSPEGVSRPDNMFQTWCFDLPDDLKEKDNELTVTFFPTKPVDSAAAAQLPYVMPDTRVFTRKAQYQSGWDWGPKINTCGIWKNVYIRSWSLFKTDNLYVRDTDPTLDPNGVWKCEVEFDLEAERDMRVKVMVDCAGSSEEDTTAQSQRFTRKLSVKKGVNKISVPVTIAHPKLWWPNGMGAQNMYAISVSIEHKGKVYEGSLLPNVRTVYHGLRTVELVREKDDIGESFGFMVNGKPCYMRGANWIPASSYPGCFARPDGNELYYTLLHDAAAVNMNMIRVWGGGLYEDDAFYSYCDRLGLLVWQDFLYACNPYPGDEAFLKRAKQEAVEQVRRLRTHPCIAVWCGNNEVHNGLEDWGWQGALNWTDTQYKQLFGNFKSLFEELLPAVLEQNVLAANYVSTSPTFGWGHPECCTHGCAHYWGVWWGEMPFEVWPEKTGRFMTEYGFQSYPEMATIEAFTTPEERKLGSPSLNNHQKHGRGVEIIRQAMLRDFNYTKTSDLSEFAYMSQLVQAEGIAQAIDAHRSQHDKCRGTLYWQLNDCWPVASWSSIDSYGRWKALHYRLRELYANVAIAVQSPVEGMLNFYVVNDSLSDAEGELRVTLVDLNGGAPEVVRREKVRVPSNSATLAATVGSADIKGRQAQDVAVRVQWLVGGKVRTERVAYLVKPKDLRLKTSDIEQTVRRFDDYIEVTLTAPTLHYGVQLCAGGDDVVRWSDNYFTLLPNEPRTIRGHYADTCPAATPEIAVRSLVVGY